MALASGDEEALSARGVAGEILDTAVEHCRRGEREQALAMFGAIRAQLDPPPGILRIVRELEATGCSPLLAAGGQGLRVQAGTGWDSNVSQGITARDLVLGSGDNILDLALDPAYRPRASTFANAAVDYSVFQPASGVVLQVAAGLRNNFNAHAFDLANVSGAISRQAPAGPGMLRGQIEVSEVWLGNLHYERSEAGAAQYAQPSDGGSWSATLSGVASQYFTQPTQNSVQWDLNFGGSRRLGAAVQVDASLSMQYDHALAGRPGGDRHGWQWQGGAVILGGGWRFRPQITLTRWNSAEVFAPGLIDVPRRNRLTQALLQAEKPLDATTSIIFEWRGRWAQDTVVLYRYNSQVLSATVSRRF